MKYKNNWKTILIVLIVIMALALLIYFVYRLSSKPKIGGDRDIHGCIGSAGYTWC